MQKAHRTKCQGVSVCGVWGRGGVTVVQMLLNATNVHAVLQSAARSWPVSSASRPPLSDGRRGVARRAAEDQRHAGGDPEEDGQPVQAGQHLHQRRLAAPGRAQLCHQQVLSSPILC